MSTRADIKARLKAAHCYRVAAGALLPDGCSPDESQYGPVMVNYAGDVLADLRYLLDELARVEAQRDGLARFNPDWDMLSATQDSLREHQAALKAERESAEALRQTVRWVQAADEEKRRVLEAIASGAYMDGGHTAETAIAAVESECADALAALLAFNLESSDAQ